MIPSWDRLANALRFWVTADAVDAWFDRRRVFFVTGMGRSGTKLLAELLGSDPESAVLHEPIGEDFAAMAEARHSPDSALEYVRSFRKKRVYLMLRGRNPAVYGEVNSNLRYHLPALKREIPGCTRIHLVRDGRDVVRSLMARRHYTDEGEHYHRLAPPAGEPLTSSWNSLDRFEKICWLWQDAVSFTEERTERTVRLEDLVSDYEQFRRECLEPTGVRVDRMTWKRAISRTVNETTSHVIPGWEDWPETRRSQFEDICGHAMRSAGYWSS